MASKSLAFAEHRSIAFDMPPSYQPYEPRQQQLLPQALQDWLPESHLANYISDTVDGFDLSAFHARYSDGGPRNQPFHPAMMVKVLIYGYATGVFSSRKIARKLYEDVAFRVLGAGNFPAHRTICDFRSLHLRELAALFVQVVRLASECGLVKLGTIAIDGTKIKANASRHKAMSYQFMVKAEAELKAEIEALLEKARAVDEAERNEPELDIPAELTRRKDRLAAIAAAKERLEARQRDADLARGRSEGDERIPRDETGKPTRWPKYQRDFGVPEAKAQESFTDSESRIMKHPGGRFDYSYNAHTVVDSTAHIIVAVDITNSASDAGTLPGLIDTTIQNTGVKPEQVLADSGFKSEDVFAKLRLSGVNAVVALGREDKEVTIDGRKYPHTAAMSAKLASIAGRCAYRMRKWIVEPPYGWIKNVLGFRQFSLRGKRKVEGEWNLICLALNLRRMCSMQAA
jgi:transposase